MNSVVLIGRLTANPTSHAGERHESATFRVAVPRPGSDAADFIDVVAFDKLAAGSALAGGNALVAHGILERETEDIDLFSPEPGGPGAVVEQVRLALSRDGYTVEIIRPPEAHQGEFARLEVSRGDRSMHVDLARDWRRWPPVRLEVGPVLHLDDAVSSKVNTMVTRRLPRDFIDVAAVLARYPRDELMRLTFTRDPGRRVVEFTDAARQLDRLTNDKFHRYGLSDDDVEELRRRFADWPREERDDHEGHQAHAVVAEGERRRRTLETPSRAATLAGQAYPAGANDPVIGPSRPGPPPPEEHPDRSL